MKKKIISLLTTLVIVSALVCMVSAVSAWAATSGDYTYKVLYDDTVEITGYIGSATELEIPDTIDGMMVTSIGEYAFYGCNSLISITIQSNVKSIGENAFENCDLTIYCYSSTASEQYAIENGLKYELLDRIGTVSGFKTSSISKSEVNLTWNKVTDAEGYIVYKYDTSKKTYVRVTKTTTNVDSYTVSGLSAGTSYTFAIRAYKTVNGKEILSEAFPTAKTVTKLKTVTGFKASNTSNSTVKLTWSKISNATGYVVYKYDTSKKTYVRVKKTTANNTAYTVSGLSSGTSYIFAIRAYKTVNGKEILSEAFPTAKTVTKLKTVTGFKASNTSNSTVKLTWSKISNATGYVVYKYDTSKKTYVRVKKTTANNTAYTVSGLSSGTSYIFAIRAYKTVNGKEILSEAFPVVKSSTTPATVSFSLKAYPTKVTVNWNKVSGASGYLVYYKTSANGNWQRLKDTTGTSYTKTGLTKGKTYYFTVKAYKKYNGKTYNAAYTTKNIKTNYCTYSASPTAVEKKGMTILDNIAKNNNVNVPTLKMAYNWCKMSYVINKVDPSLGTDWYADFGLTYHYGNCYVMAGTFTKLAKLLGYNAVQISGNIPLRNGSVGPHSWVEIKTTEGTFVCDPDLEYELGTNHYLFKYHPVSAGSNYYIVGDGKHVKYHRISEMK